MIGPGVRALTVLLVVALLTACGGGTDPVPSAPSESLAGEYVVTTVTDAGEPRDLVPGSEIRLTFSGSGISITAGCNQMSGDYVLKDARLTVTSMATTEMGCDPALMEQDAWIAGLFAGPVRFTGTEIISGDVVLTIASRASVSPDLPLEGIAWVLESIGTTGPDGAVAPVPPGVVAYLRIAEGRLTSYDGCNSGDGAVETGAGVIVLGEVLHTLRGCLGDDVQAVQTAMNAVLAGTVAYAITEQTLTLTKSDRLLEFRAADELPEHD